MKTFLMSFILFIGFIFSQAQSVSLNEISRKNRFDQQVDEFNNGKMKIKYSDIKGIPYYYPEFLRAKIGETGTSAPIRYNSFLDTIEIVDKENVYQLPKEESNPAFVFENTKEKIVFVKTGDQFSGYFFELNAGKYQILKKVITKYIPEIKAPNPMIAGTPGMFVPQKPIYFLKTEGRLFQIDRSPKDLATQLPEKSAEITTFISKNKIKLHNEEDLIKLGNYLNQ